MKNMLKKLLVHFFRYIIIYAIELLGSVSTNEA